MTHPPYPYEKHLKPNEAGRDFVVGDLHGSYQVLQNKLALVEFNPLTDRLFSVGDLIDRGEDSLACLELLRQPWFHAVQGNHEVMFLQYLGLLPDRYSSARDFIENGGRWFEQLPIVQRQYIVDELAPLVHALPYRICVFEGAQPFQVVHAQWGGAQGPYPDSRVMGQDPHDLDRCTWGRNIAYNALREFRESFPEVDVRASETFIACVPPVLAPQTTLTYSGHCILPCVVKSKSHVFLDTGAYQPTGRLSLMEHATGCLY